MPRIDRHASRGRCRDCCERPNCSVAAIKRAERIPRLLDAASPRGRSYPGAATLPHTGGRRTRCSGRCPPPRETARPDDAPGRPPAFEESSSWNQKQGINHKAHEEHEGTHQRGYQITRSALTWRSGLLPLNHTNLSLGRDDPRQAEAGQLIELLV